MPSDLQAAHQRLHRAEERLLAAQAREDQAFEHGRPADVARAMLVRSDAELRLHAARVAFAEVPA
jgi:hypothetical protein